PTDAHFVPAAEMPLGMRSARASCGTRFGRTIMHLAMIGAGYVGLVSGACFSDFGHHVVCVDKHEGKIESLKRGQIPIYEPGLTDLVTKNAKAGRLSFDVDIASAVGQADVVFIAVGTP